MTLGTMQLRVAENLGILADDGATIREGLVTSTGINSRLNDIYREELFPILADKFPFDFEQETYPRATYTSSGTVDAGSSDTTLVATSSIFNNDMEGFEIHNADTDETVKITTYTNGTTVTVDSAIDDWVGDAIYVLGNVYTFGGDTTDIKEILNVSIKYTGDETYYRVCEQASYNDLIQIGNEQYSKQYPYFYRTTVKVGTTPKPAIGFIPYPEDYAGSFKIKYIARPPSLGASDEPSLNIPGISEVMIYGATAWGFRLQKEGDDSDKYQALYESYKSRLIGSYRPRGRSGPSTIKIARSTDNMRRRVV